MCGPILFICFFFVFFFLNLCGPSPEFYRKIADIIEKFENETCILCGDFNLVQDQEMDMSNYLHINNPKAKECVLNLKEDFNLVDTFRELKGNEKRYTWRKNNPLKQARLDFFLVSECFMPSILNVDTLPSYRSDHSTVVLSIKINEFKKGTGLWKFNNSLLKDLEYAKIIKECIQQTKEQYMVPLYNTEYLNDSNNYVQMTISDQLFLEVLLIEIRGKTISYASFKKKSKKHKRRRITKGNKNIGRIG